MDQARAIQSPNGTGKAFLILEHLAGLTLFGFLGTLAVLGAWNLYLLVTRAPANTMLLPLFIGAIAFDAFLAMVIRESWKRGRIPTHP